MGPLGKTAESHSQCESFSDCVKLQDAALWASVPSASTGAVKKRFHDMEHASNYCSQLRQQPIWLQCGLAQDSDRRGDKHSVNAKIHYPALLARLCARIHSLTLGARQHWNLSFFLPLACTCYSAHDRQQLERKQKCLSSLCYSPSKAARPPPTSKVGFSDHEHNATLHSDQSDPHPGTIKEM